MDIELFLSALYLDEILEFRHLNGINCAFVALVAILATATVESLLLVVSGKQTIYNRYLACGVESCNACCNALADVVEVRSLTANYATQDNHCIISTVQNHLMSSVDKLEATRNGLHVDVLRQCAVLLKSLDGSIEQSARDVLVPFGYYDAEAHVACIGNGSEVVKTTSNKDGR